MSYFRGLLTNLRFYILVFSGILAVLIYGYVVSTIPTLQAQISKLTQLYALTAVIYLYLALLASPLTRVFTFLPFRGEYVFARRALGVSAWFFAELHMYYAFFGGLGGFNGLQFLNNRYLLAISLGATTLGILSIMALTSFDFVIDKLSHKKWKWIHRLVYLAAVLITIHALMLGSHFTDISGVIPQLFSVALVSLLILESLRFDMYLNIRFPGLPKAGIAFSLAIIFLGILIVLSFTPAKFNSSLSLHAQHQQSAREAQNTDLPGYLKNLPGMQGDKTKRFTVDWDYDEPVETGKETLLKFRIFNAASGAPVELFTKNYEKLMHLIIVDSSLDYYQHVHPEFKQNLDSEGGWFETKVVFPTESRYNLYLDFVPLGAVEQQIGLSLKTANYTSDIGYSGRVDQNLTKEFGNYIVKLSYKNPLKSSELSVGAAILKFEISDNNRQPVTTLKPYLGSFGHLVMINTEGYEYIHVHPVQAGNLLPDQNGGPVVEFMPVGIYGPIKPGIYKLFAQFNPNDNLTTSMFTVKVE